MAVDTSRWEIFCDESYYHMWTVRPVGERDFNKTLHVVSQADAKVAVEYLDALLARAEAAGAAHVTSQLALKQALDQRDAAIAERDRLAEALAGCHALLVTQKFEPDDGAPPMVKDGVWDRIVENARAALASINKEPTDGE